MPATTDVSLFSKIDDAVLELESFLVSQMQMKLENTLDERNAEEDKKKVMHGFNRLIDLHMIAYATTTESKQTTTTARNEMNEKRVELQDIMYERKHILEEIVQCRQFRSVYQDVELIPEEEFRLKAGPEYLENADNEHQLKINRFKYELVLRKALKEQKEALELEKAKLIKENRKAQKKVDQFDKLLDDFVLSAVPVEEALQLEALLLEAEENKSNGIEPMMEVEAPETTATPEIMDTTL